MEYIKLKNVAQIYLGLTHTPKYVERGVPFLSVKDISGGKIDFSKCHYIESQEFESLPQGAKPQKGDLLFCRVGTIGKPIIIDESMPEFGTFVSLGFLRCINSEYTLEYLKYWMNSKSFYKQVKQNVKGVAQINLNTGWLKEFSIPVKTIKEQRKIVKKLDKIQEIIDIRKKQIEELDELIKSQFVEMFGDININNRNWEEDDLKNHLKVIGGYAFKSSEFKEKGIPVLRIGNINAGYFRPKDLMFYEEKDKLSQYLVYPNDVVMSLTGTVGKEDYGNICIMSNEYEKYYLNQRNAKLNLNKTINEIYVANALRVPEIKKRLTGISRGVRQANIANKDIENLSIPIPPIELQNQFSEIVKQIDKQKLEIQKSLEETQKLQESLMSKYFG